MEKRNAPFFVLLGLLLGCGHGPSPAALYDGLSWEAIGERSDKLPPSVIALLEATLARAERLRAVDVEANVEAAIARNDYTLLGYGGYVDVVPGIDARRRDYIGSDVMWSIGPKGCVVHGVEDFLLRNAAAEYARRYNATLLEKMRTEIRAISPPDNLAAQ